MLNPAPHALTEDGAAHLTEAVTEAEDHFHRGRIDLAHTQLETLIRQIPAQTALRARALSDLAVIAAHQGRHDQATTLAADALYSEPGFEPAREILDHYYDQRVSTVNRVADALQQRRIQQHSELSTCLRVRGTPTTMQPILTLGRGRIEFGESVVLGYRESPGFYESCIYLEAEGTSTVIEIGAKSFLNNGCSIRAQGAGVKLGERALIGWSVQILDSDFHELHPDRRHGGTPAVAPVILERNVFVGANSIICKGVTIGENTVVGAGSVVVRSLPAGVVAAGNPATVIRELES